MKIQSIKANNHRRAFDVTVGNEVYSFPYSKVCPAPTQQDPIVRAYVDDELGQEGFTYVLRSGSEGSVHVESVLEYNEDPVYMRDLLLYNLTVEAQKCMAASPLTQAEIMRRARTSASQIARLLDTSNRTKSVDRLLVLLGAMDCAVEFTVHPRSS
ncbi:MAG: hypothetical protein AB2L09_09355 [Coriobacteriia bacterium]